MSLSKNNKILIAALILALMAASLSYRPFLHPLTQDWQVKRRLNNNAEWLADYQKVKDLIERDKKDPNDVGRYFTLGLAWKTLGEKTHDSFFFEKALEVYDRGAKKFGAKNILFYWNAGKLAEELGQYQKAENYYLKSIALADSYAEGYQYLAELYRYKLKLSKEKVAAVYDQGIKKLFNPLPLVQSRAAYLRSVVDYAGALPDYELLAKNFPENQGLQEVVKDLRQKINNK